MINKSTKIEIDTSGNIGISLPPDGLKVQHEHSLSIPLCIMITIWIAIIAECITSIMR